MEREFIPVLFAGDINVYSVARAFYEEYDVKAKAFGRAGRGICSGSRIMDYKQVAEADRVDVILSIVNDLAEKHRDKKIIVIGCGDAYVRQISANKGSFAANVIAPYVDIDLMSRLTNKEKFYNLCESLGVAYPETFVCRKDEPVEEFPFEGPFIIKPSDGVSYWEHPFNNQDKIFKVDTRFEAVRIIKHIFASGYDDSIVVQNFIPGDDTYMRVLTNYSDRKGRVRMTCHGHVLLEEHTPHGSGNHAVIITERNEELESGMIALLDGIGYTGFSNFDVKYDRRDGKYKVFELNARQGRSNYYVTGAGENIARYLVEDLIYEKELPFKAVSKPSLWMVVPKKVAFDFIEPEKYKIEMKGLINAGNYVNPLINRDDMGAARRLRVMKNLMSHHYKFRKYYGKKRGADRDDG
ncbi:MAG: ATP-grasp domain-containing protein [Clostridiales Family XIII bacterium]|jgi:D-aspartate ligase|nr:ATP-grasp domain-containing protein [Clostridiales Family XIII bacterium]